MDITLALEITKTFQDIQLLAVLLQRNFKRRLERALGFLLIHCFVELCLENSNWYFNVLKVQ